MSDKVVGKIFVTSWKNYKKFRDNENNRNLDERHHLWASPISGGCSG